MHVFLNYEKRFFCYYTSTKAKLYKCCHLPKLEDYAMHIFMFSSPSPNNKYTTTESVPDYEYVGFYIFPSRSF